MDYRKQLETLGNDITIKFGKYLKLEDELVIETNLSANGFIDKQTLDKFNKAKLEWQIAVNEHNNFFILGLKNRWFNKL